MASQATRTPLENQFIRQFGVPIDSTAVFPLSVGTYAGFTKEQYITNSATSGLAYSGMIIADLTVNKIYVLGASGNPATRGWIEVGAETVDDLFSTSGIMVKTGNNTFASRGLDSGSNIDITNASGLANNPIISLSTSVTGLSNLTSTSGVFSNKLAVSGSLTLNGRDITTSIEAIQNTNTANFSLSVGSVTDVGSNGGPSYYGTFDQGGNVREIMHSGSIATVAMRGGNFASDDQLVNTYRSSQTPTAEAPGFGFRLSSRENIGKSYPLTFNSTTGITASGSVIHGFQLGDPLKFANDTGLPVALSSGVTYYVKATGSTTFSVGTGNGGAAISVIAVNGTTSAYSPYDYSSFVRVENSGNNANAGYGAVNYNYRIGKFEVTNDEYVEFLNAVARDDHDAANNFVNNVDMGLYSLLMETEAPNNGISRNASFPDYYYAALRGMNKKPVVFVSYMDAARYANWLHNGKPVSARYRVCLPITAGGMTTVSLTNHGFQNGDEISFNCLDTSSFSTSTLTKNTKFIVAGIASNSFIVKTTLGGDVTFNGTGTFYVKRFFDKDNNVDKGAHTLSRNTTTAIAKNAIARYWVSTENEWYKAAYYDPAKSGVGSPGYWAYPTRSDTVPTPVSADSDGNGSYNGGGTIPSHNHSSYDISDFVDRIGGILDDGTGTQVAYNSTASSITVNVTGIPLSTVVDVTATATEVNYLSGVNPGTGVASRALVLNANKSISGILNLMADTGVFNSGSFGTSTSADSASTLRVGGTGVSLSGHKHYYTAGGTPFVDIPNFCSGVADCVNTPLVVSTGLRADTIGSNFQLALSGQAATLHTFTSNGIIVRSGGSANNGTFAARSIASGANINVTNGTAIDGNPTVSLAPSVTGLTDITVDQIKIDGSTISTTGNNDSITLAPNGTGGVNVDADTLRVGDSNANATITTNGTGDLTLNTNSGTSSSYITITDAANGDITLSAHGTGEVNINKVDIDDGNIDGTTIGASSPASGTFTGVTVDNTKIDLNKIYLSNVARIDLDTSETIINSPGSNINFRVAGSGGTTATNNLLFVDAANNRVGIGTSIPLMSLDVRGDAGVSGNFSVGGNLTVTGTTVITNVDIMRIKDPIILLGSGTTAADLNNDRGLSLALSASVTGFLGWSYSANEFIALSSGVPGPSSGTYAPGTYGAFRAGNITSTGLFSGNGLSVTGALDTGVGATKGQINLNGSNGNFISWNTSGQGVPTSGVRSSGTKLVLYPDLSSTNVDTAIGTSDTGQTLWYSIKAGTSSSFKWYGGASEIANLNGFNGNLAVSGTFNARGGISGIQTVGSITDVYTSTSISGVNNTTNLLNFVIDGGTP